MKLPLRARGKEGGRSTVSWDEEELGRLLGGWRGEFCEISCQVVLDFVGGKNGMGNLEGVV